MPELIDLSQEIYHKRPSRPSQPSCAIWDHTTHEDSKNQYRHGGISFRIKGLIICDHEATHTDAFTHIDPRPGAESIDQLPLTMFYTSAICLDMSHIDVNGYITTADIQKELDRYGLDIRKGDTILFRYGIEDIDIDKERERYFNGFAGPDKECAEWLVDMGVVNFATESRSADGHAAHGYEVDPAQPVHQICRDRKVTNTENLRIPKKLVGKRFQYIGFPIKIRGGTGAPVRAVAVLDE